MNKVELAELLGLEFSRQRDYGGDRLPSREDTVVMLFDDPSITLKHYFLEGNICIVMDDEDRKQILYHNSRYNLSKKDYERYYLGDFIAGYDKAVWEKAADSYLEMIKKAAVLVCEEGHNV